LDSSGPDHVGPLSPSLSPFGLSLTTFVASSFSVQHDARYHVQ
jgi:hypothetical protein